MNNWLHTNTSARTLILDSWCKMQLQLAGVSNIMLPNVLLEIIGRWCKMAIKIDKYQASNDGCSLQDDKYLAVWLYCR